MASKKQVRRQPAKGTKTVALATAPERGDAPDETLIRGNIHAPGTLLRGPGKARKEGPRPPRLSNHKARSHWFHARAAYPARVAPVF